MHVLHCFQSVNCFVLIRVFSVRPNNYCLIAYFVWSYKYRYIDLVIRLGSCYLTTSWDCSQWSVIKINDYIVSPYSDYHNLRLAPPAYKLREFSGFNSPQMNTLSIKSVKFTKILPKSMENSPEIQTPLKLFFHLLFHFSSDSLISFLFFLSYCCKPAAISVYRLYVYRCTCYDL